MSRNFNKGGSAPEPPLEITPVRIPAVHELKGIPQRASRMAIDAPANGWLFNFKSKIIDFNIAGSVRYPQQEFF